MSQLLLFGGNSLRNQSWIREVENQLHDFFAETHVHDYQHRIAGEGNMNIDNELEILYPKIKDQSDSYIFAKSLGTVLMMRLIVEKNILPHKCIFVGLPLGYIKKFGFPLKSYLSKITCPILFIQNKNDPLGGYQQIVDEIGNEFLNFHFKELEGDDHEYTDLEKLKEVVGEFI